MKIAISEREQVTVAKYWHTSKNKVDWSSAWSNSRSFVGKFWWRCLENLEHEWQMTLPHMLIALAHHLGCPFCAQTDTGVSNKSIGDDSITETANSAHGINCEIHANAAEQARKRATQIVLHAERTQELRSRREQLKAEILEKRSRNLELRLRNRIEIAEQRASQRKSKQLKKSHNRVERRKEKIAEMLDGPSAMDRLKLQAERKVFVPLEVHLGRAIRSARRSAYLSKKQVAERLEISVESLSKIELGDPHLTVKAMFEITTVLGNSCVVLMDMVPQNCEPF